MSNKKKPLYVSESCSCGAGANGPKKYVKNWRRTHIHGDVRNVESSTQRAPQYTEDEGIEDNSDFKTGFQPS